MGPLRGICQDRLRASADTEEGQVEGQVEVGQSFGYITDIYKWEGVTLVRDVWLLWGRGSGIVMVY